MAVLSSDSARLDFAVYGDLKWREWHFRTKDCLDSYVVQQSPCKLGSRWCDLAAVIRQDPTNSGNCRLDVGVMASHS